MLLLDCHGHLDYSGMAEPLSRLLPAGKACTSGAQYLRGGAQVNELITVSTFLLWHLGQTASFSRSAKVRGDLKALAALLAAILIDWHDVPPRRAW